MITGFLFCPVANAFHHKVGTIGVYAYFWTSTVRTYDAYSRELNGQQMARTEVLMVSITDTAYAIKMMSNIFY